VKKLSSKLVFLKFAMLYCIIFCVPANDATASNTSFSNIADKSYAASCLADAPDFYCHTIHAGVSASTTILPGFKNSYPGILDPAQPKQLDQRLKFSLYIFHSGNLLTKLRKSDIIYPFHYFW
jgi:hypothetical protein